MAEFNDGTQNIVSAFDVPITTISELALADDVFYQSIEEFELNAVNGIIGGTAEGNVKKVFWRN